METVQKKLFLKQLDHLTRSAVTRSKHADVIQAELKQLHVLFGNLLQLIQIKRNTDAIQQETEELEEESTQKVLRLIWMKHELEKVKREDAKLPIINKPLNTQVKSSEVVLYACKISSFIQAIPGLRKEDTIPPASFFQNIVDLPEIQQSGVYLMYKNNPEYKRLEPPKITYLKGTDQFCQEQQYLENNTVRIKATQPVVISIKKDPTESIIYTVDGSEPNPCDVMMERPLDGELEINEQFTVLKVKIFKAGYITSPTATFKFEILDSFMDRRNENLGGIVRPDALGGIGEIGEGYDDMYDSGGGYASLHLQHSYSTPTQSQY